MPRQRAKSQSSVYKIDWDDLNSAPSILGKRRRGQTNDKSFASVCDVNYQRRKLSEISFVVKECCGTVYETEEGYQKHHQDDHCLLHHHVKCTESNH